jgi:hypothetical protein
MQGNDFFQLNFDFSGKILFRQEYTACQFFFFFGFHEENKNWQKVKTLKGIFLIFIGALSILMI